MSDLLFFAAGFFTCFVLIVFVALFVIRAYRPASRQIDAIAGDRDPWQAG
jgi:cytochrome c biogenesis protein CcdA